MPGLYTGMILLDLQKVFDTGDHEILCRKLKTMSLVDSTYWFMSYLQNRRQIVTVGKTQSDPASVTWLPVEFHKVVYWTRFCFYVNDMVISIDSD